MPDRRPPDAARLALSALVLAASDLALLAVAASPAAPPAPPELRLPALARGLLEHLRG